MERIFYCPRQKLEASGAAATIGRRTLADRVCATRENRSFLREAFWRACEFKFPLPTRYWIVATRRLTRKERRTRHAEKMDGEALAPSGVVSSAGVVVVARFDGQAHGERRSPADLTEKSEGAAML